MKTSNRCNPQKLKEHFKKHFEAKIADKDPVELVEAPSYIQSLQELSSMHIKTGPPDMNEIISVIKKLKQGKAASDIPIDFIKHALESREFLLEIVKLYKTVWETNMIPNDWRHSKLNAIWKGPSKGKYDDPSAYRGLQIGSSFCKILITIINKRLKNWYERQLSEQQQGFRASRGTADGIFIAKQTQQITAKMKKTAYVLFVDLSAAFDPVERSWMFKSISDRFSTNSNMTLIQLIKTLYDHTTTALAETPDDKFELTTGVRQGGPESPMLYNLYMDYIMRIYLDRCKTKGIKFLKLKYKIPDIVSTSGRTSSGELELDWTGYADDLMLTFDDKESLQNGIMLLDEIFKEYRIQINISKTKTIIFNHQHT